MTVDYDTSTSVCEEVTHHDEWRDEDSDFTVTWINLHYYITHPWWMQCVMKNVYSVSDEHMYTSILRGVSGQMKAGKVTALLGPSGSGKSILFDCLVSRRVSGVSGRIRYQSKKQINSLKVAYVEQNVALSGQLTVRELIRYSSRLQNSSVSNSLAFHEKITLRVIKSLGLEVCADNLAARCSGGQMKRIAIAVELVTAPSILILDEPTSGLDSTATSNLIHLLKSIADGSMYQSQVAIIVSIHQPSWEAFNAFDNVIMMSKLHGRVIYDGLPCEVPYFLTLNDITFEETENPADLLMELACGSHGTEGIERAVEMTRKRTEQMYVNRMNVDGDSLVDTMIKPMRPFIKSTVVLLSRCLVIAFRDRYLLALRTLSTAGALPILYLIFEASGGEHLADGCPLDVPSSNTSHRISPSFIADVTQQIDIANARLSLNVSNILMLQLFCFFTSVIGDLFSVTRDFAMIRSEVLHHWYPLESIITANIITEFIITLLFNVTLLVLPWYFMSEQKLEFWRILIVCMNAGVSSLVAVATGGTIASTFIGYSFSTSVYAAFIVGVPQLLLAGHLIASRDLPLLLFNMYYFFPLSVSTQSTVITLYGFERCKNLHMIDRYIQLVRQSIDNIRNTSIDIWSSLTNRTDCVGNNYALDHEYEHMVEAIILRYKYAFYNAKGDPGSLVMARYDYDDADLGKNLFWLTYQLITYRFIYYLIYRYKLHARH